MTVLCSWWSELFVVGITNNENVSLMVIYLLYIIHSMDSSHLNVSVHVCVCWERREFSGSKEHTSPLHLSNQQVLEWSIQAETNQFK